ncbi:MAG: ComF family protein [Planctomycetota bacterium]
MLSPLTQGTSHLLWPGRCLVCQQTVCPEDEQLCMVCWQNLSKAVVSDYCRCCGRDVSPFGIVNGRCGFCQDKTFQFDGIARAGAYESTLRSMILAFKFSEKTELSCRLAPMLKQAVQVCDFCDEIDIVSPVPLHWRRKLWRGFNQSYLLAKSLNMEDVEVSTDLVRIRNTAQQWDLTGPQRRRNVKGAFAVRKGHPFEAQTVLLVDDITTSNATLSECAKTLKSAGAKKVYAAVLATAFHDEQ